MYESNKTILQLLKDRKQYEKIRSLVPTRLIDFEVRRVISCIDSYWKNYDAHAVIEPDVFMTEFQTTNQDLDDDQTRYYAGVIKTMMEEPNEYSATGIIRTLRTMEFAEKLEKAYESYQEGLDIDIFDTTKDLVSEFEKDVAKSSSIEFITDSIDTIIEDERSGHRFRWSLACLNGSMPNVRTGQQHIFAARPGKGKTSFCAAQAVAFAAQSPDGRPVCWFNNEGKGRVIKGTTYRAALKKTFEEIVDMGSERAAEEYAAVTGSADRIRIFDVHGRDYRFIERIIDTHRPSVVFFDMLDNVKGFEDAARTDLRLEYLYQWARESCVIYDFLSIPTKQVSVEGDAIPWVPASALKDSKTGVQGACDSIITMGYKGGPEWLDSRFLYIPKTKAVPEKGYRPDCAQEVRFDGARCLFKETIPAIHGGDENPNPNV